MDEKPLRTFVVYFKDGSSVHFKAASFKMDRRVEQTIVFSLHFHTEGGENGAIYIDPNEVAAIIPQYSGASEGQVFKVALKSGKTIEIRAANFTTALEWLSFRKDDGSHIADVWVRASEVLACFPTVGLPSEFKFPKSASPSS